MRLAAALVLAALLAVVAAVADEAVSAAYYEGRSGEILFKPTAWTEPSSFVSVMNKKLHAEHIDDVSVADLISHVSGRFLPINAAVDRTVFPSVNIFAPPMATVVTSISSLSTDDARMLNTMAGQSFTPVRGTSFPADPLARLTTMLTGATPSVHGIIGASWPTSMGLVTAYVSEFGQPRAANFPTLVSNAFSGKSLVLSASGSAQFASAMNAMPDLIAMHTNWNNMQVFWNGDDIVTTSPAKKEHLNRKEILSAGLASVALPANAKVEYDAATGALIVTLAKGVSAKFDLTQAADLLLVAELRIAGAVVALLEKNEAVRDLATDSIPDVIALSFVSLDAIKAAHGAGSVQARVALALIDAAIDNVNTAVAAVYNNALVSVLLGVAAPPRATLPAALMQELIASNVVVAEPHPEAFLPAVYVHASAQPADEARLCSTLSEMAAEAGVGAVCRFSAKHLGGARLRDAANLRTPSKREETVGASQHAGDISSEDVQVFHTVLWSSVLIALAIGGVIMVMCGIDTTKDTLLFRVSKSAHH